MLQLAKRTATMPHWGCACTQCDAATACVALQENVVSPRCEEDGCRKFSTFGYPGGRPVQCAAHRLDGMVGSAAAGSAMPHWGCACTQCNAATACVALQENGGEPQMRRGGLPQTSQLWLPRGQASAMRLAQARRHGRQCCSWQCAQQMCPSKAALAQGAMQQLPVWACRRT